MTWTDLLQDKITLEQLLKDKALLEEKRDALKKELEATIEELAQVTWDICIREADS